MKRIKRALEYFGDIVKHKLYGIKPYILRDKWHDKWGQMKLNLILIATRIYPS